MASKVPVKSILKQKQPADIPTEADRNRRNLAIALHHANLIQAQKDIQAQILLCIEKLLDLPTGSEPTPDEARSFASLVYNFQPSDLDALVEERNIEGKCGYTLCPNSPRSRSIGANASWKLSSAAVDYCSDICARKNLYVKTQLGEIPAWQREPGIQAPIVLHEDDQPKSEKTAAVQSRKPVWKKTAADDKDLAMERGETPNGFRPKQVMTDMIVEKSTTTPRKTKVAFKEPNASHTAIEGYEPKSAVRNDEGDEDTDDDT
ncbi:Hypothetical protein R9X50_00214300 [Acrodontium crateriforme]|uniref:RNA polymerase II subunit B1 CTD phosphatase RPAP2 homolog n=1 Tax=Acrodontium crateriforme TaxID=150365 RepID=A0AAQ3M1Y5_9PEZI|nr:Hypothetical protein R9X50_00214300 [Acrodontium crateriforme]